MTMNTATKLFASIEMQMETVFGNQEALEAEFERMANECMRTGFVEVSGTLISILTAVKDADVNWVYYATKMLDPIMARIGKHELEHALRPQIIEFIRQANGSK